MGAFGTVSAAYSTLAETLNTIGDGIRLCAADGKGAAVDTWNTSMGTAADEVAKLADVAVTTSTACDGQDAADSAMQAQDPTPAVVAAARDRYAADPTPENKKALSDLRQQRADALAAHSAATEGTTFPDVPSCGGTGIGTSGANREDGGDGSGGSSTGESSDAPSAELPITEGPENTEPAAAPPPTEPGVTSPSTVTAASALTPTSVHDTSASTTLSSDNSPLTSQSSALSSGINPSPSGPGAQQGVFNPAAGIMLNPNTPTSPTRQQRKQQEDERRENVARAAETAAIVGALALPDAIAAAQSYNVPGTPSTSLSHGGGSQLGQTPAGASMGQQAAPPHSGPIGPSQTAAMGSGTSLPPRQMRYRPPPPPPPPFDAEKERREEERREAERKLADAWR